MATAGRPGKAADHGGEPPATAAYAALVTVQLLFATLPVAGKLGLRELDPFLFVQLRMIGAALFLVVVERLVVGGPLPGRRDLGRLSVFALFGVVLNQGLFMVGLDKTTAVNTALLIAAIPVLTYTVALLARKERLAARRGLGILVGFTGILVLLDPTNLSLSSEHMVGNLLLVANGTSYSIYLVISKPILQRLHPLTVTAWIFLFGSVLFLPAGLLFGDAGTVTALADTTWLVLVYVILGPTVAVYALNLFALSRVPASTVAAFIYLQPIASVSLAAVVLGETIGPLHIVAGALVLVGVALVTRWRGGTAKRRYLPAD